MGEEEKGVREWVAEFRHIPSGINARLSTFAAEKQNLVSTPGLALGALTGGGRESHTRFGMLEPEERMSGTAGDGIGGTADRSGLETEIIFKLVHRKCQTYTKAERCV